MSKYNFPVETIGYYLSYLPEPYNHMAIAEAGSAVELPCPNTYNYSLTYLSKIALERAFVWQDSELGLEFWWAIEEDIKAQCKLPVK